MNSTILRWLIAVGVATFGIKVFAHTRLKTTGTLVPRSTDPGLKSAPCGGALRLANSAVFAPGQTITVNWEETIQHPGRFEFYFSTANDANFGAPIKVVPDDQDGPIVGTAYHQFTTQLTLPNVTCDACTLQLIQVMTEVPAMPSYYYACADIKLQSGAVTPSPTPTPTPPPAPSPGPAPHCKTN